MGFQDALCNVCAPLSIKIDIDPARMGMAPQMPPQGGSMVDRDHKYDEKPCDMGQFMQDFMSKMGMCPTQPCGPALKDKPDFNKPDKPDFDKPDKPDDEGDEGNPFDKDRVKK